MDFRNKIVALIFAAIVASLFSSIGNAGAAPTVSVVTPDTTSVMAVFPSESQPTNGCDSNLAIGEGSRCNSDDQNVTGYLTLSGPRGQQVAVYCVGDAFQHAARPDWVGFPVFSGSAIEMDCDTGEIFGMFPGYRLVINTSLTEGWVVDPWNPRIVRMCVEGELIKLTGMELGAPPDVQIGPSSGCGYDQFQSPRGA